MKECLSVVIPCFNEESTIAEIIARVLDQECVKEILVIDDASTDNSTGVIRQIQNEKVKLFQNKSNLGKGASVRLGFHNANSKYVLIQDADLEYSP
jgi:glycosyltransferase involved in cell wall biosynthesis